MKYIMAEARSGSLRRKIPCIFPTFLVHSEVASAFRLSLERHGYADVRFVSAGTVTFLDGRFACHGESETLGLKADVEDGRVIELYDYLGGL